MANDDDNEVSKAAAAPAGISKEYPDCADDGFDWDEDIDWPFDDDGKPLPTVVTFPAGNGPRDGMRTLSAFTGASMRRVPLPRRFVVADYLPQPHVTVISGRGGIGKSTLALQLACDVVLGRNFFGRAVKCGPVVFLSAEDDRDELNVRLAALAKARGFALSDIDDLHIVDMVGEDCELASVERGVLKPTPLLGGVAMLLGKINPRLLILDSVANFYGGDENNRREVRTFLGLLTALARRFDCAVLILAHPSVSGMATKSGLSGSTAWINSARSRMLLDHVAKPGDVDDDVLALSVVKANYAPTGRPLRLRFVDGCFVAAAREDTAAAVAESKQARAAKIDALFTTLLRSYRHQGRPLSPKPGPTYAPVLFAGDERAIEAGVDKEDFRAAESRLLNSASLLLDKTGRDGKERWTYRLPGEEEPAATGEASEIGGASVNAGDAGAEGAETRPKGKPATRKTTRKTAGKATRKTTRKSANEATEEAASGAAEPAPAGPKRRPKRGSRRQRTVK